MIKYTRFELANGLRVLVHEDDSTPMAAVNLLFDVGARDESPDKTGFAHLFEHLMFSGTPDVPNYDDPLQHAGGDCNAFTNNDITNFYDTVPAENLEVALWLEADRLSSLKIKKKNLSVQQKVVVEEFKETCLNEPYGDVWHLVGELTFQEHPYQWPTIGKSPQHVENATLEDVRSFYQRFYTPCNAILVVAGHVKTEEVKKLVDKWFSHIPSGEKYRRDLPKEPAQATFRQMSKSAKVPLDALYMAFHAPARMAPDFYPADLLSDVLCNGQSSRLFRRLLKERQLVTNIDCYLTGSIDPGLFIIEAKPVEGVSLEAIETAIWKEIDDLKNEEVPDIELQKIKNKIESNFVFSEMNVLSKAINLAFYELLGDADHINEEIEHIQRVSAADIQQMARKILTLENCSTLYYRAER